MEKQAYDRIDAFWRGVFGASGHCCDPVIVGHHLADLLGYPGIYCIVRNDTVHVSAPDHLVGAIAEWRPTPTTVIDATWWNERLPTWSVLGPSCHAFTDHEPPPNLVRSSVDVHRVAKDALGGLRSLVSAAEWDESGLGGHEDAPAWRAVTADGDTAAGSILTPFDGLPADVGVLTAPPFRGSGAATAVAGAAVAFAAREFGIVRWRALTANLASRRVSEHLGFEPDCLQLAVRPA